MTYQVVDQNGNPMPIEGLVPMEWGTASFTNGSTSYSLSLQNPNGNSLDGPPGGCITSSCEPTNSSGQFTDPYVGVTMDDTSLSANMTQNVSLTYQGTTYSSQTFQWNITSYPLQTPLSNGYTAIVGSNGANASGFSGIP